MPEFTVSPYPYFFIGSLVVAFIVACGILRAEKTPRQIVVFDLILVLLMTMFGAVMFGLIRSGFKATILEAGFSSLGGAIGLILASVSMAFIYPQGKDALIRAFLLVLPLMYGIAKVGCFLIGCCHGIAYDGPMAVRYNNYLMKTGSIFPVQLAESITFIVIFIIGVILYRKHKNLLVPVILALSSIGKFSWDFLREEHIGKLLTTNQVICIVFLIISVLIYIIDKVKKGDIYNGT